MGAQVGCHCRDACMNKSDDASVHTADIASMSGLDTPCKPPAILVFHQMQVGPCRNIESLRMRLKSILNWALPLVAEYHLKIVEVRCGGWPSILPECCTTADRRYEDVVKVHTVEDGSISCTELLAISGSKALVCGGVLEQMLYICHDLARTGSIGAVGMSPLLCGNSGRSGELSRAHLVSHLEEVLATTVLGSLKSAARWLVPEAPPIQAAEVATDLKIKIESQDNHVLTEDQSQVIALLLPENVTEVTLIKIGRGFSDAVKFFCIPTVSVQGAGAMNRCSSAMSQGSMTFIKLGDESDIDAELNVTHQMMQLLGNFCPQVLGYAEVQDTAALHLSLANLGSSHPRSFLDLYEDMLENLPTLENTAPADDETVGRIEGALDFVFGHLVRLLHGAKAKEGTNVISMAAELGLTRDHEDIRHESNENDNISSGWVLEKLWRKGLGDGGLASSVRKHMADILGEEYGKKDRRDPIEFVKGHLRLPDICGTLLEQEDRIRELHEKSKGSYTLCFVHGDLHGENIMVDAKDNRFLIDFGKSRLGYSLEDITWLESFVILSYTDILDDTELDQALDLVPFLSPFDGLTADSCESLLSEAKAAMQPPGGDSSPQWVKRSGSADTDGSASFSLGRSPGRERKGTLRSLSGSMKSPSGKALVSPRIMGMWIVVCRLRSYLGQAIHHIASISGGKYSEEMHRAEMVATMLLLRNSLFLMSARENKDRIRVRKLALALACAYARTLMNMLH
eukprot:TRINITY_DN47529_c0_g1_i1.p1 TRINITY_DN47529_c0_g1~~TRINITY_DN47529_c0_g1_i1.p1  ORF type:complete len:741 (-),score=127.87 TRINITY_DN47529_c0_g1_i1:166-2388(-)